MVQCCNGKLEIVQCFSNPSFEIESKLIFKESGPLILTPKITPLTRMELLIFIKVGIKLPSINS